MNMLKYHDEEGFKGPFGASLRFIDEAKKILSFVGVNPKAEEFCPRDSSLIINFANVALAYIRTVNNEEDSYNPYSGVENLTQEFSGVNTRSEIVEKEAEEICHCRKRILSVALKNLCGNCKNCKESFQETCVRLINWAFSCPHDFTRKNEGESCHELLLTVLLQNCLEDHLRGPNCLTYSDATYSSSYEDNMEISENDDSFWMEEVTHQNTEEESYNPYSGVESTEEECYNPDSGFESTEEEFYNPYSGVENLTQEFSGVSRSSEMVYYPVEWNPYNQTFFNIKQD